MAYLVLRGLALTWLLDHMVLHPPTSCFPWWSCSFQSSVSSSSLLPQCLCLDSVPHIFAWLVPSCCSMGISLDRSTWSSLCSFAPYPILSIMLYYVLLKPYPCFKLLWLFVYILWSPHPLLLGIISSMKQGYCLLVRCQMPSALYIWELTDIAELKSTWIHGRQHKPSLSVTSCLMPKLLCDHVQA